MGKRGRYFFSLLQYRIDTGWSINQALDTKSTQDISCLGVQLYRTQTDDGLIAYDVVQDSRELGQVRQIKPTCWMHSASTIREQWRTRREAIINLALTKVHQRIKSQNMTEKKKLLVMSFLSIPKLTTNLWN